MNMSDTTNDAVVIERTFAAPIETLWSKWATSEGFASWYGPQGATIPTADMDVTVGGRRHICMEMQGPNGAMQMWFVGEYVEIEEPTRLVYTEGMSNEAGESMSPATTVTVVLTSVDEGTHMVMTHVGIPADSPGAMGWQMAIDKLADQTSQA